MADKIQILQMKFKYGGLNKKQKNMLKLNEHEELDGAQLIWLLEEMKEFLVFTTQHNIFSFSKKILYLCNIT